MNLELRLRILQHGAIASKARVMASIFDMVSRYRPLWLQDHLPSRRDSESIRFNPEKHEKEVQLNLADLKSTSKGLDYFIPVILLKILPIGLPIGFQLLSISTISFLLLLSV